MAPQIKNTLAEVLRALLIAGVLSVCSAVVLASRLEERVQANKDSAARDLSAAVAVRRAEQAAIVQDNEQIKTAMREMLPVLKELSKDSAATKEAVARLEVTVSYLAKGQDEIKSQLGPRT